MRVEENPLKFHADYLRKFWEEHGKRRELSQTDWGDTIGALRRAGEIVIVYKKSSRTPRQRRAEFDKVKNIRRRYRFNKGDFCFACGDKPDVRHHIIWIKNGGRNNRRNICFLCHSCHAAVHPWLQGKF